MTTKLIIYNAALMHLGARKLASLSEARKSRRVLDAIWDNGFVKRILEKGQWNFAIRTFESTYDPDIAPAFGYQFGHRKPPDWVRTLGLSGNEDFNPPLNDYQDERDYWFVNNEILYLRIVSVDQVYGGDLSLWPQSVVEYTQLELAALAAKAITDSDVLVNELHERAKRIKTEAKAINAMNQATKKPPMGSWSRARLGGYHSLGGSHIVGSAASIPSSGGGGGGGGGGGSSTSGAFSDGFSEGFF